MCVTQGGGGVREEREREGRGREVVISHVNRMMRIVISWIDFPANHPATNTPTGF